MASREAKGGRKRKGTLIKDLRSGVYILRVMVNGKFLWRTTGTTSKRDAEAMRERLLHELGVPARTNVDILANVVDKLESESAKAERAEAKRTADKEQTAREAKRLPLDDTWAVYLKSKSRPDTGDATLRQYELQWNAFMEWLRGKGVERLAKLTPELVAEFFEHLEQKNIAAGTFNKYIQTLKLIASHLPTTEDIPKDVFAGIRRKVDVQEVHKEIGLDQLWKICEKASGEMKLLVFLGSYTGMRLKDCCLLQWDEVDLMSGIIRHTPFKTASKSVAPLIIPIHPNLRPLLEATPIEKRHGPVMPKLAATYAHSNSDVTDQFQNLLRSCGLSIYKPGTGPESVKKDKKGRPIPGTGKRAVLQYGFHSLRHSAVTLLREAGAPQAVVAALVGHNSKAMTNRYTHIGESALQEWVGKMPTIAPRTGFSVLPERSATISRKGKEITVRLSAPQDSPRAVLLRSVVGDMTDKEAAALLVFLETLRAPPAPKGPVLIEKKSDCAL